MKIITMLVNELVIFSFLLINHTLLFSIFFRRNPELTKWWAGNGIFNAYFVRLGRDINKIELFHLIHRFTRRNSSEVPYLPSLRNTLSPSISRPLYHYLQHLRLSSSRTLLADDATPVSSPLTPLLTSSTSSTEAEKAISKPSKVQVVLKAEAFLGKGLFKKRPSYHPKGKCGLMVRPECRLTVVLREITPAEEAEIAKLRVSNFKKLTKREKRLVPHKLIETTPIWNRKGKVRSSGTGAVAE
ncbi:hypothetical protein H5410_014488 [Solanum commersonii]|uniref:Uncharacterized protein n=1 Tax=Solanum commersonii TaxID=4109 RepID=A0A9J5ZR55_SOLCO|nr:hypothetical protein H5410_014488 [Solanum commersonii]